MIPEKVLELCDEKGGQWRAMARNYRAARSKTHREAIARHLMANFTGPMWLTYYQAINGAKGGAATSEAKAEAARGNGRLGGRPRKRESELSPSALAQRRRRARMKAGGDGE
jgi:hypothetical protein